MDEFSRITQSIYYWYREHKREMPWRKSRDPYVIWLSEIILQQTRVAQGTPYFEKFYLAFPTVGELAEATEDRVLKLWQGLGYYSRARNLHETARDIYFNRNGKFPSSYADLLKLKGVGPYTAAAIASIAFDEAKAVVDGNVVRVISRLFSVEEPFDTGLGKKRIQELADRLIDAKHPGDHNQAMMELGSLICTPHNPQCPLCPVAGFCQSRIRGEQESYPVKQRKTAVKTLYFNFLVPLLSENKTWLIRRTRDDIWKNLFTFPMHETEEDAPEASIWEAFSGQYDLQGSERIAVMKKRHVLSHRLIQARFYMIRMQHGAKLENNDIFEVDIESIELNYPLPRLISGFLEDKEVSIYFE